MLIEFRVSNFRSIGEEQVLSLLPASNQKEYMGNIWEDGRNKALNAVALYGANGSGKSNLLAAMRVFDAVVTQSARTASTDKLLYDPFLLREGWASKPTKFEAVFSIGKERYRYGFEFTADAVLTEWLFRKGAGREVSLFEREKDVIYVSSGIRGNSKLLNAAIEATRPNAFFLSMCDVFNVEEAKMIFQWFSHFLHVDGMDTEGISTVQFLKDESFRKELALYLEHLNLGFSGISLKGESTEAAPIDEMNDVSRHVWAEHKFYSEGGAPTKERIKWDYAERESSGSIKALQLGGPVLLALAIGGILVIDEMEAKLHPLITLDTISLFLNKDTNPKQAQLIFATHDTNLLSYSPLRRDQIYFAEKNKWESTEIYSLSDFVYVNDSSGTTEKERPDTNKEKRYIEGRYGAIPVLGKMNNLKFISDGKKG